MGTWEKVKKLLGLGPDCVNGGERDNLGNCNCSAYYEGKTCEKILCANHGIANKDRTTCHCPDNKRHYGVHCELTKCENNGKDTGKGACLCVDDWYTGDFCQHYSSPWGIVFGVSGAAILLLVVLCVLCRLKPCCRPHRRPRSSSSSASRQPPPSREHRPVRRPPPPSAPQPPPYDLPKLPDLPPPSYYEVVRDLDKYPTSNPCPTSEPLLPPPATAPTNSGLTANPRALHCDERTDYEQP